MKPLGGPFLDIARRLRSQPMDMQALKATMRGRARSRVKGNVRAMVRVGLLQDTPQGLTLTARALEQLPHALPW